MGACQLTSAIYEASRGGFDVVVVGGGTAGCVLAARLSEDPARRVLLLEAGGPDESRELHYPSSLDSVFGSTYDWDLVTEPQAGAGGRPIRWPRGKVLGGSSSINSMIYSRGNPFDYEQWSAVCPGWDAAAMLGSFIRSEDNARGASRYHGVGGPLRVEDLPYRSPSAEQFVGLATRAGYAFNDDFCGAEQLGVGYYQFTTHAGRRWSTATGYLAPARHRANLIIVTKAHVRRLALRGQRVEAVEFTTQDGGYYTCPTPRSTVVLAGGAVGTPELLLRSGLGPADELSSIGIPVSRHLPAVGKHLRDHIALSVPMGAKSSGIPASRASAKIDRGPMTTTLAESGGFFSTTDAAVPDAQWLVVPSGADRATVILTLLDVKSAGAVSLHDAEFGKPPRIDPGYLCDDRDVTTLVRAVRRTQDVLRAPAGAVSAAQVRAAAVTLYHPVGTCRMGSSAADSVCDAELRVWDVENLHIADASVMPSLPRGNTNAVVVAIAERAAELLTRHTGHGERTEAHSAPAGAGS